ncbi:thioredoxin family protein [Croceivirga thetidis]|uniref:Thioredoxin family protein n=1 Tax=Croceivirga thetidis TaxID=2721623 RepID=A0ABX1GSU0_9FLAO|nr:thioredoxin family protein [Croceivirga thetidis]NKI33020.1 thioredoxin family protein [Croceivirga thetidis]
MRNLVVFLVLSVVSNLCIAQEWEADFSKALKSTSVNNKSLLLVFSGSDWCIPCMKLERNIWESEAFKSYAKENLVLYRADFPQKKKNKLAEELTNSNKVLAEKYNYKGYFPLVVLLDSKGNTLGEMGYENIPPTAYVAKIKALLP